MQFCTIVCGFNLFLGDKFIILQGYTWIFYRQVDFQDASFDFSFAFLYQAGSEDGNLWLFNLKTGKHFYSIGKEKQNSNGSLNSFPYPLHSAGSQAENLKNNRPRIELNI